VTPELKAHWLAALRGGQYRQGEGYLCAKNEGGTYQHCCLGVLAEVAGVSRDELYSERYHDPEDGPRIIRHEHLDTIGRSDLLGPWLLPSVDQRPNSFDPKDPETHTTMQQKLAGLNDAGCGFTHIADWIEENV